MSIAHSMLVKVKKIHKMNNSKVKVKESVTGMKSMVMELLTDL